MRHRVGIRFAIKGDLRFLSHRDTLRLFERAVARAGLPIRYSQGFNPQPRLWLLMPRSVGVASKDELLIVELDRPEPPELVQRQLAPQMPTGIVLGGATDVPDGPKPRPVEVVYTLELGPTGHSTSAASVQRGEVVKLDTLAERIRAILSADRVKVQRVRRKRGQPESVDLRPWLVDLSLTKTSLTATLRITPEGSARPVEWLEVLGLDPVKMMPRMTRVAVRWEGLDLTNTPPPEPNRPAQTGKDMKRGKETNDQATDR